MANGICHLHRRSFASVAYSQLDLMGGDISELGLEPEVSASEGASNVVDIRDAIAAEADPDDVEAIPGDAEPPAAASG